jgi:predicted glutamine amidotransferase
MCEILGLSFARPLRADFALRQFARRCTDNADGWGLAWYPDRSLALVKEPIAWQASAVARFLESCPRLVAPLYLAHVRDMTTGEATHTDTHPFARKLAGRDYCFAHNGTLSGDFWKLPVGRFRPVGNTDSELLFCLLLGELETSGLTLAGPEGWRWLGERLANLNRYGKLNAVLADGRRLFCYHDVAGLGQLHFREFRVENNETPGFEGPRPRLENAPDSGLLSRSPAAAGVNQGYVIATYPLGGTGWEPLRPGELTVFEGGTLLTAEHWHSLGRKSYHIGNLKEPVDDRPHS